MIGLSRLDDASRSEPLDELLRVLALRLYDWYVGSRTDEWRWFEPVLSYDNARLPQALIAAGFRLDEPEWRQAGIEALDWYAQQCGIDTSSVQMIGNQWRLQLHPLPVTDEGDEQPLEVAALVEALVEVLVSTKDRRYGLEAVHTFEWFLGRNRYETAVYDFGSGGCHDGIGPGRAERQRGRRVHAGLPAGPDRAQRRRTAVLRRPALTLPAPAGVAGRDGGRIGATRRVGAPPTEPAPVRWQACQPPRAPSARGSSVATPPTRC